MGNFILTFCLVAIFNLGFAQVTPQWEWARNVSTTYSNQAISKICIDDNSNIYVYGTNSKQAIFDSYSLPPGNFIAKYNSQGGLLWVRHLNADASSIACDKAGNLYLTGSFTGNFMPVEGCNLPTHGGSDIFLLKYTTDGYLIVAKHYGAASNEVANDICTGIDGSCYITGSFLGYTTFDSLVFSLSTGPHSYLIKTDNSGEVVWGKVGQNNYYDGLIVREDRSGNIYVSGSDHVENCEYACGGQFLSKYDKNGDLLIDKPHVFGHSACVYDLSIDNNNDLVIIRYNQKYSSDKLEKYDSLLNLKWSRNHGGWGCYGYNKINFDKDDNIYSTGVYGEADPPCISVLIGEDSLYRKGTVDLLITKLDPSGNYEWSIHEGGNGYLGGPAGGPRFNGGARMNKEGCLVIAAQSMGHNNKYTVNFSTHTVINNGDWWQSVISKLKVADGEPVGIAKNEIHHPKAFIHPNPSKGKFVIAQVKSNSVVSISDITGKCIFKGRINSNNEIDLSETAKGIYFLQISNENELYNQKIIID